MIAADGASSKTRKQLGIQMVGEPAMQHLVNIHFFSRDLSKHILQRPAMLYFVFSSQAIVVLVNHNLQEGEMVAQARYSLILLRIMIGTLQCSWKTFSMSNAQIHSVHLISLLPSRTSILQNVPPPELSLHSSVVMCSKRPHSKKSLPVAFGISPVHAF